MIKGSVKQEITITLLVLIGLAFIGGGISIGVLSYVRKDRREVFQRDVRYFIIFIVSFQLTLLLAAGVLSQFTAAPQQISYTEHIKAYVQND